MRNQTQEVILNESIYIKFKNRQSMMIEMRIMATLQRRGIGWEGAHYAGGSKVLLYSSVWVAITIK